MKANLEKRDTALASGILGFAALIVIAVLLYTLMQPAISEIGTMMLGRNPPTEAEAAIQTRLDIFGGVMFYALFLGTVMIIARSVVESRRPG